MKQSLWDLKLKSRKAFTFYACNESENKGHNCMEAHGTFCINSRTELSANREDHIRSCHMAEERIKTLESFTVSVNIYSHQDDAFDTLRNLFLFLKSSFAKEELNKHGVNFTAGSTIRRADYIELERFTYRAQADITLTACGSSSAIPFSLFDKLAWDITQCNGMKIEGELQRGEDKNCKD